MSRVFAIGKPRKASEPKGPMASFRAAARKIEKQIAELAAGGDPGFRGNYNDQVKALFKAINRLEDRANKPEIRGEEALREEAWAITKALREKVRAAEPIGFEARQAGRRAQIVEIRDKERDRILNMSPSERAKWQYQEELKLMRGR